MIPTFIGITLFSFLIINMAPGGPIEQKLQAPYYKGGTFNGVNIIAQYKPEAQNRICIAAHWDSRNEAEKDPSNPNKPSTARATSLRSANRAEGGV